MNEVDAGRDRATPTSEVELGARRTRDRGREQRGFIDNQEVTEGR